MTYERIYGAKVVNINLLTDSDNADTPSESIPVNAAASEDDNHKGMVIDEDKSKFAFVIVISGIFNEKQKLRRK